MDNKELQGRVTSLDLDEMNNAYLDQIKIFSETIANQRAHIYTLQALARELNDENKRLKEKYEPEQEGENDN